MICLGNQKGKLSEEPCSQGQLFHKIITVAPAFFACPEERALSDIQVSYRQHAKPITRTWAKQDKIDLVKIFHGKKSGRERVG